MEIIPDRVLVSAPVWFIDFEVLGPTGNSRAFPIFLEIVVECTYGANQNVNFWISCFDGAVFAGLAHTGLTGDWSYSTLLSCLKKNQRSFTRCFRSAEQKHEDIEKHTSTAEIAEQLKTSSKAGSWKFVEVICIRNDQWPWEKYLWYSLSDLGYSSLLCKFFARSGEHFDKQKSQICKVRILPLRNFSALHKIGLCKRTAAVLKELLLPAKYP